MQVIHSHQVRNRCQTSYIYTDSDTDLAPLLNIQGTVITTSTWTT